MKIETSEVCDRVLNPVFIALSNGKKLPEGKDKELILKQLERINDFCKEIKER